MLFYGSLSSIFGVGLYLEILNPLPELCTNCNVYDTHAQNIIVVVASTSSQQRENVHMKILKPHLSIYRAYMPDSRDCGLSGTRQSYRSCNAMHMHYTPSCYMHAFTIIYSRLGDGGNNYGVLLTIIRMTLIDINQTMISILMMSTILVMPPAALSDVIINLAYPRKDVYNNEITSVRKQNPEFTQYIKCPELGLSIITGMDRLTELLD